MHPDYCRGAAYKPETREQQRNRLMRQHRRDMSKARADFKRAAKAYREVKSWQLD